MAIRIKRKINGNTLSLEAGKMAKQANGAVLVRYADTTVLCTATMDEARPGIDFFPLTVDYRGKNLGGRKDPGGGGGGGGGGVSSSAKVARPPRKSSPVA